MIVKRLIDMMIADANVSAIAGARIYEGKSPDAPKYPFVTVNKISGLRQYTNDGDAGIEDAVIQIDTWADTSWEKVVQLKDAIVTLFSGYKGAAAVSGEPHCRINSIFVMSDADMFDPATERAGVRVARRMLELRVWHREL